MRAPPPDMANAIIPCYRCNADRSTGVWATAKRIGRVARSGQQGIGRRLSQDCITAGQRVSMDALDATSWACSQLNGAHDKLSK